MLAAEELTDENGLWFGIFIGGTTRAEGKNRLEHDIDVYISFSSTNVKSFLQFSHPVENKLSVLRNTEVILGT